MKTTEAVADIEDDLRPEYDLQSLRLRKSGPGRTRGPQKAPTKIPITIRLDPDVLEGLRATGKGWQTRANAALRDWLQHHHRVRS
ncbi:MAG: BrnA antitoxin family protein [Lamprobacter sp.]|uniref:BrnA antitoxin family protein n=1 Tax=Lamprobacter sp. TaxID=3100796 RepID=UPI002B25BF9C|nr:BrnA antitoxin family protein [Lamprobacter sp.]MEA3640013.1 BrnA antitoxin family protein [Lamprobacter sp.]